jgi:hypothetical protein
LGTIVISHDVSEQVEALRSLKENWDGVYTEIESVVPEKASVSKPTYLKVWASKGGKLIRVRSSHEYNVPNRDRPSYSDGWCLLTEDFAFSRRLNRFGIDGRNVSHSARIASVDSPMLGESLLLPITGFFGLDKYTGAYWFEVLENPDSIIQMEHTEEGVKIKATHRELGDFEFRFERQDEDDRWLLREMKCQNRNLVPEPEKGDVTSYTFEVSNMTYRKLGDRNFIESLTERHEQRLKSGATSSVVFQQHLTSLSVNHELKNDRIVFPDIEIADGTKVNVRNDEGIPYEIHRGVLVRVVDSSAVITPENARFRLPPAVSWQYYGILVCILVFAIGVVWYWRRE